MSTYELQVELREGTGKELARKLRGAGKVPAVIYGLGRPTRLLMVERGDVEKYLREVSGTTLILLKFAKGKEEAFAIIKDFQLDPVRDTIIHLDFLEVDLKKKTVVTVPISYTGTPKGVEMGGVLEVLKRDIEVECLPAQIPDAIYVDVTPLEINEVYHIQGIQFPEGVETIEDPTLPIVAVKIIEEEEEVEEVPLEEVAEEAAEAPEVTGEDTEED